MRTLQQHVASTTAGAVISGRRDVMTDTADRVTDKAIQIGINRPEMADVLGVSALPFASSVGILGVTRGRGIAMAGTAVGIDRIAGRRSNCPGGIGEVEGAAGMAAFAVTGRLVVVNRR